MALRRIARKPGVAVCKFDQENRAEPLALCGLESEPISSYQDQAKQLAAQVPQKSGQTRIVFFGDHNQAYYAVHQAFRDGVISAGAVYLHLDTHNDSGMEGRDSVFLNPSPPLSASLAEVASYTHSLSIASFIAPLMYEGLVDEMHWVLPIWATANDNMMECYRRGYGEPEETYAAGLMTRTVSNPPMEMAPQLFLLRPTIKTEQIFLEINPASRSIPVHTYSLEALPNMAADSRPIILDIDQDWITNTGYDTDCALTSSNTLRDIEARIDLLIATLQRNHIHPNLITISSSPEYTYSDTKDDAAALLLEKLLSSGTVSEVEVRFDRPSYSIDEYLLTRSLFLFVRDNFMHEPRINAQRIFSTTRGLQVYYFNEQRQQVVFEQMQERVLDFDRAERNGIFNRRLPEKKGQVSEKHLIARGDYSLFIEKLEVLGLMTLAGEVRDHQSNQQNLEASEEEVAASYARLLDILMLYQIDE